MVELNNWHNLPWKRAERQVFRLQKRIYQASQRKDYKTVHKLQKLLTKSWYGKAIATRKVTQENKGKKSAGIDGKKVLSPNQRLQLLETLKIDAQSQPVRRMEIPNANRENRRSIPTSKKDGNSKR